MFDGSDGLTDACRRGRYDADGFTHNPFLHASGLTWQQMNAPPCVYTHAHTHTPKSLELAFSSRAFSGFSARNRFENSQFQMFHSVSDALMINLIALVIFPLTQAASVHAMCVEIKSSSEAT